MEIKRKEAAREGPPLSYSQPTDAARVRSLLTQLGLSQREGARELGANEREMRYWCSGERPVPRMVVLALERLLEMRRTIQGEAGGGRTE